MNKFNNAKALALGQGITVLASFLMLPYLSRSLQQGDYGSYGQVLFYVSVFNSVALIGLNKVIFIYLSKPIKKEVIYTNNLFACLLMGLILTGICALSSPIISMFFDNQAITIPIIIFAFSIPFETMFTCYSSILVNENKSKVLAFTSVVASLIKYISLFFVIQYTDSFLLIFICLLLASIIQLILVAFLSKVKLAFDQISTTNWKDQIKMGVPLGLTSIIGTIYYVTDGFVVSYLLSEEDYAILRNGGFQIPFISTLYTIIGIVLMRDIGDYIQKQDKSNIVSLKARAIALAILLIYPITIFLIVFAGHWIPYLFTSLYQGSIIIFMIYNIMTLFRVTSYESIIVLSENSALLPKIYFKSFLLNLILSIPLTYYLGPSGSAIATIISFLYLVISLTKLNLKYLEVKLSALLNYNHLAKILTLSIFAAMCPYLLNHFASFQQISPWFLPMVVFIVLAITYHILFKTNYVSQKDKESFFNMIPIDFAKKIFINLYCK